MRVRGLALGAALAVGAAGAAVPAHAVEVGTPHGCVWALQSGCSASALPGVIAQLKAVSRTAPVVSGGSYLAGSLHQTALGPTGQSVWTALILTDGGTLTVTAAADSSGTLG